MTASGPDTINPSPPSLVALQSGPFAVGDIVSDSISVSGEIDEWEFQGQAGQELFIDFLQHDTGLRFVLRAPDGSEVVSGNSFDALSPVSTFTPLGEPAIGPVDLVAAGTYTFEVRAFGSATPNYQFQLREALAADIETLTIGSVLPGNIETSSSRDHWTIDAMAGQTLWVDLTALSGSIEHVIEDPNGDVIWVGSSFDDSGDLAPLDIFVSGSHTLRVYGFDGALATYQVELLQALAPDVQNLNVGDTVSGSIETPGSRDQWIFAATTGQIIGVEFLQLSAPVYLAMYAPDGSLYALGDAFGAGESALWFLEEGPIGDPGDPIGDPGSETIVIPGPGNYTLEVEWARSGLPDNYQFTLTETLPDVQLINIGDVAIGEILNPNEVDHWEFSAAAGQSVYVDFQSINGGGISYQLVDESGNVFVTGDSSDGEAFDSPDEADSGLIILGDAGTYTIQIQALTGPGDYQFQLLENLPPNIQNLNLGDTVSGGFNTPFEQDHWKFTAVAGQRTVIDFPSITGGTISYSLVGPDQAVLGSGSNEFNSSLRSDVITLPIAGEYTVQVMGDSSGTISYQLHVVDVPPDSVRTIAIGENVLDDIVSLGARDRLEFAATAGQTVFVDFQSAADDLALELLAPDGSVVVAEGLGSSADDLDRGPIAITQTGTYAILLTGLGDVFPSAYEFDLLDVTSLVDVTPISFGASATGEIESAGARDQWTFTATQGQSAYIDFSSLVGDLYWSLKSPSGAVVAGITNSALEEVDSGPIELQENGQYTLEVLGVGDETPTYALTLFEIPPPVNNLVNIGDTVNDVIAVPGRK